MRERELQKVFATQTLQSQTERSLGSSRTGIVFVTLSVEG